MKEIKASALFPVSFKDDFKSIFKHEYTKYTFAGGRGSCKSSFVSLCIILLMLQDKNRNAVVIRKTARTLRDSAFAQLRWAVDTLGVSSEWAFTYSPLQATYVPTGQTVFFRGADDTEKIKSIKPTKGYTAITWFEELTEFTERDVDSIKLSTMRGGEDFWIFSSFNPPASARHWCNGKVRHPDANEKVSVTDYRSVNADWLGSAFLAEAEAMQQANPRAYRNIFLGEPTGTGATIFENVNVRRIEESEISALDWHYYGVDWGYYPDPFRYVAMCFDMQRKRLFIYDELTLRKAGNEEASDKLLEHIRAKGESEAIRITADSAEPKSVGDFRRWGWNMKGAIKGRGSLEAGFKWLQQLNEIIIDSERCPDTADEFSLYEYEIDKRTGEVLSGYPQGQPDHSMAAVRYAMEEVWMRRGN